MVPKAYLCAQSDFPALRHEWNKLAIGHRLPTLSHEWCTAALAALEPHDEPSIILTRSKSGDLTGAAPLLRRSNAPYLTLLGNDSVPEPAFLLFADQESLRIILARARRLGFPLRLGRIPHAILSSDDLRKFGTGGLLVKISSEAGSPCLPIHGEFNEFEAGLSAQRRGDLRRARRRADSLGPVQFDIAPVARVSARAALERFIELERRSWKATAGTSIAHDRRAHRFFSALVAELPEVLAAWITIGGRTVAGTLAMEYAGSMWILKTAYDEEYRACSPGVLLMHELVRRAFDLRLETFEFLGVEERWLELWTREVHSYYTADLYTYSPQSAAALWQTCCIALRRRLRRSPSLPVRV